MHWPGRKIREEFLRFFAERGHEVVPSSSLLPPDETLLFTNAGMNQFKSYFMGLTQSPFPRATSVQKCMRAGGKLNDLDQVGFTPRHHTFFEMLGNFSFGDYFKEEAITWAWELVTGVYGIPGERLVATVFREDDEAYTIWRERVGLPEGKVFRLDEKDNFWEMGDVGPVGYCSEIHYDFGPEEDPDQHHPGQEGNRFLELWNLVFMQFFKDEAGRLTPLPKKNIDTGAGLERIASVLQGVRSNYETDLFVPIIEAIEELTGERRSAPHQVMADHTRALVFCIADGIYPSNYGRGYVLRRILRRAHSFAQRIGVSEPILHKLVPVVVDVMGDVYPGVADKSAEISEIIKAEEERFLSGISRAMPRIMEVIDKSKETGKISGRDAFSLYDTYGVPLDLLEDYAKQSGLAVDWEGFHQSLGEQRARAREASGFKLKLPGWEFSTGEAQSFVGYEKLETETKPIAFARGKDRDFLALQENPFYPESGGQLSDRGRVFGDGFSFTVEDVQDIGGMVVLVGRAEGSLSPGARLTARVNGRRRKALARAHTATHLLHAALREIIGESAMQRGSLVDEDRLRFDFSCPRPLSSEELAKLERLVNEKVLENIPLAVRWMEYSEARQQGAIALFEGKYGERVRVVEIPGFSRELCGGTHLGTTAEVGQFMITSEEGVAAGIRRIEALVGIKAWERARDDAEMLSVISGITGVGDRGSLIRTIMDTRERVSSLERDLQEIKARMASQIGKILSDGLAASQSASFRFMNADVRAEIRGIAGVPSVCVLAIGVGLDGLRLIADSIRNHMEGIKVLLLWGAEKETLYVFARSEDERVDAGRLAREAASLAGGKGGGNKSVGQGGARMTEINSNLWMTWINEITTSLTRS
ncbi:MAG: alanine--tRNA ligase [candidate division WOR-3 bacterium]